MLCEKGGKKSALSVFVILLKRSFASVAVSCERENWCLMVSCILAFCASRFHSCDILAFSLVFFYGYAVHVNECVGDSGK